MTETTNFKLKKPDLTDPVDVSVFNGNFDIIDDALSAYVIDLSGVLEVDLYGTSEVVKYPYDGIVYEELLAAYTAGKVIAIKVGRAGYDGSFYMTLNSSTEVTGISLSGVGAVGASTLVSFYIWGNSADSVGLSYRVTEIKELVRTVNGVEPDEDGNVVVETAEEKPVKLDLSGYYDGVISRIYADGGASDIAVTFDEAGNPVSFSNGEETFEVVWPAEETTEETTTEETTTEETTEEATS